MKFLSSELLFIFTDQLHDLTWNIVVSRSSHLACQKETQTQVFSCEYCKNFKNTYFEDHLLLSHVWADAPGCCLSVLAKLTKQVCRTVGPSLTVTLGLSSKCCQLKSFLQVDQLLDEVD